MHMVGHTADFDKCTANALDDTSYVFVNMVQVVILYWGSLYS